MSVHGKGDDGYILLDVLVSIFLIIIGFGAVFAALRTAVDHSVESNSELMEAISLRNDRAENFETILSY